MPVKVHIPTPLRPMLGNKDEIEVEAQGSIHDLLYNLANEHKDLKKHLFNDKGELRNFVNIYINEEDIRYQEGPRTAVKSGDVVSIVPSIAGGAGGAGGSYGHPFTRRT